MQHYCVDVNTKWCVYCFKLLTFSVPFYKEGFQEHRGGIGGDRVQSENLWFSSERHSRPRACWLFQHAHIRLKKPDITFTENRYLALKVSQQVSEQFVASPFPTWILPAEHILSAVWWTQFFTLHDTHRAVSHLQSDKSIKSFPTLYGVAYIICV